MSDYHNKRSKEIIQQILYATIATASAEGKPWNSPVAKFFDKDLNIYWCSDKDSTHSRNIRANQNIFIVVYDSTIPEGKGEAVYIQAMAEEINDPDEVKHIAASQTGTMTMKPEQCMEEAIHRFYKAVPQKVWMNDDEKDDNGNYIKDIRVEVPLDVLRSSV